MWVCKHLRCSSKCPCSSQAAYAHSSPGLRETVHGILWQLKCQILTFSYWGSFTLKHSIFKSAFSQNLMFFWAVTFLHAIHLIVQSLELPSVLLTLILPAFISLAVIASSLRHLFPWNCSSISRGHYCLRLPCLPYSDCVVTRELRPLWWVILQELMILEPTPQLKGLHYNYHSHTLHPLSIWRNVL